MKNAPCFLDVVTPKRLIAGACVLALMAALGSCITEPMVFDDAIPPEETATLLFAYLWPTSYNGIDVDKWSGKRHKWVRANIPQGEAAFIVDIEAPYTSGKDFAFAFNFEGGKEYYVSYAQYDDEYGVNIYNSHPAFSGRPANPKETLIAFVPFVNQPDTVTTTTTYR